MPGGQGEGAAAPPGQKLPAGQTTCAARVDPGGQKCPGAHGPSHAGVVAPDVEPKEPAAQGPLQSGVASPEALPKRPAGHATAKGAVEPAGQKAPTLQGPSHALAALPALAP